MPRKTNIERAQEIGVLHAEKLFRDFSENPEFCGRNFTWAKFPDLVGRLTAVSCFSSFKAGTRDMLSLEKACGESATARAKELSTGL